MPEHGNGSIQDRIAKVEAEMLKGEWLNIPDLIEMRFRLTDSRVARVAYELNSFRRETSERFERLEAKVDAIPRVVAEMLDERDKRAR